MNYYQVFMVSARTSQLRQAVTNRSHNNPLFPSSAALNEGAIRGETKRLTSRKTHKQTQACTIRGNMHKHRWCVKVQPHMLCKHNTLHTYTNSQKGDSVRWRLQLLFPLSCNIKDIFFQLSFKTGLL